MHKLFLDNKILKAINMESKFLSSCFFPKIDDTLWQKMIA